MPTKSRSVPTSDSPFLKRSGDRSPSSSGAFPRSCLMLPTPRHPPPSSNSRGPFPPSWTFPPFSKYNRAASSVVPLPDPSDSSRVTSRVENVRSLFSIPYPPFKALRPSSSLFIPCHPSPTTISFWWVFSLKSHRFSFRTNPTIVLVTLPTLFHQGISPVGEAVFDVDSPCFFFKNSNRTPFTLKLSFSRRTDRQLDQPFS